MTAPTLGAHVSKVAAAQALGAATVLTWDTEVRDDATFYSGAAPTKITAPTTGWYALEASVLLASSSAARRLTLGFAINGTASVRGKVDETLTPGPVRLSISALLYLTAADYVEVLGTVLAGDAIVDNGSAFCVTTASAAASVVAARAHRATTQSIANGVEVPISFSTEDFDTAALWSIGLPTKMIAPSDGYYLIGGSIWWGTSSGGMRAAGLRINGTTYVAYAQMPPSAVGGINTNLSTLYHLAATDYVELLVYQASGGDLDAVSDGLNAPALWMTLQ